MKIDISRQIVLDTETTGMNKYKPYYKGHRIIEIGAVEIINRRLTKRQFHVYLQPDRCIDRSAFDIHGINENFLKDKPKFSDIVSSFLDFISGSELVIHNAQFDVSFIDYELSMLSNNFSNVSSFCKITDTLQLARRLFPGKKNNLNALCERYSIDNSKRHLHSALFDAKILANIFLLMTGGQMQFSFIQDNNMPYNNLGVKESLKKLRKSILHPMKIIYASQDEMLAHENYLDILQKQTKSCCIWRVKK